MRRGENQLEGCCFGRCWKEEGGCMRAWWKHPWGGTAWSMPVAWRGRLAGGTVV